MATNPSLQCMAATEEAVREDASTGTRQPPASHTLGGESSSSPSYQGPKANLLLDFTSQIDNETTLDLLDLLPNTFGDNDAASPLIDSTVVRCPLGHGSRSERHQNISRCPRVFALLSNTSTKILYNPGPYNRYQIMTCLGALVPSACNAYARITEMIDRDADVANARDKELFFPFRDFGGLWALVMDDQQGALVMPGLKDVIDELDWSTKLRHQIIEDLMAAGKTPNIPNTTSTATRRFHQSTRAARGL
ncbi:uncharacterized protein MAM_01787 [Metarhizium album ARSEF 1941]|uniref:Uncharacterized protein n=1 Tax=Metarhizium album (strain ARSEF 1941) TaxID=1081103 RepID=A0A0B2X0P5_METAS|nr:uncharacterized protein MAM_01787 [Metarhizium album ARSEF 1941]KHN99863.1 hypothetical protein MAM_01787 [Metarhizium album ARSEF 1941]